MFLCVRDFERLRTQLRHDSLISRGEPGCTDCHVTTIPRTLYVRTYVMMKRMLPHCGVSWLRVSRGSESLLITRDINLVPRGDQRLSTNTGS